MAITVSFAASKKGINFDSYLKAYDKKFVADGRGGMTNEVHDTNGTPANMNDDVWRGDGYVSWDGIKNGQSVILEGGADGWKYVFDGHVMSGSLTAITFGHNTKDVGDSYTNNREIRISFDEIEVPDYSSHWVSDLTDSELKNNSASLKKFLGTDSIEFTGSKKNDVFKSFAGDDTLNGGKGNDKLNGGSGDDILIGGKGNDTLIGGKGNDTFVFADGHGKDKITDFGNGDDVIDFSGEFADFDAVMDAATQSKQGVTISYDGGSVLLAGVKLADLDAADFVFPEIA